MIPRMRVRKISPPEGVDPITQKTSETPSQNDYFMNPSHSTKTAPIPVTLIPGDGIGPEVVDAARRLVDATGVPIAWEEAHAGASIFRKGIASGVPQETLDSISRTRLVLKGPLETPVGF